MSHEPDFHVVSLHYKLCKNDTVTYKNPPELEFETEVGKFVLNEDKLKCEPYGHFASPAEAREAVEPFLRAWELDADLQRGRGAIRFEYENVHVIDRSPRLPNENRGHAFIYLEPATLKMTGTASFHVTRVRYPDPPINFRINPDVETLWSRYQGYLDGKEPFLSMAYFCLTLLEMRAGRRALAAKCFRIDESVLRKIGELTSTRGDILTARKALAIDFKELTGPEKAWLETTIKAIIWRIGDTRERESLPIISMSELPPI